MHGCPIPGLDDRGHKRVRVIWETGTRIPVQRRRTVEESQSILPGESRQAPRLGYVVRIHVQDTLDHGVGGFLNIRDDV